MLKRVSSDFSRWKINGNNITETSREENATYYLTLIAVKNMTVTCEARNSEGRVSKTAVVTVASKFFHH